MAVIGKNPNQIPLNQNLGKLAFQDELTYIGSNASTPTVASASSITIYKKTTFISGTNTISTILVPNNRYLGNVEITLIPTGNWVTDTTGNISAVIAAEINTPITFTYDYTVSKWYVTSSVQSTVLPTIVPTLSLDFANGKDLDPKIDFTRSSGGSYTNSAGLIAYVTSNQPRFDHDPITRQCKGLLIEESRVNLLTYSEQFDGWYHPRATITANSITAPDGTVTADTLATVAGTNTDYFIVQSASITIGSICTASIFVKAGTAYRVRLDLCDDTNYASRIRSYLNLQTGLSDATTAVDGTSVSYGSTIVDCGNGWYRLSVSGIVSPTANRASLLVNIRDNTTGNVVHTSSGGYTIYIWGAQLEAGAFATSYIPTLGSFTSRSSTATYYGSDGLLKTAAANTARINYNPANLSVPGKLLLEPAATNLLIRSEQFENWYVWKTTVSTNVTTAPDGATTADKIVENSTNDTHNIAMQVLVTNGQTYTFSVYVKAAERTKVVICAYTTNSIFDGANVLVDLITGTVVSTYLNPIYKIEQCLNGWYRVSITRTAAAADNYATWYVGGFTTAEVYTGDGSSGFYIWGAQVETGYSATSYIPTTSTTGPRSADVSASPTTLQSTRSPDIATISGTNFASWYNQTEGSLVIAGYNAVPPSGVINVLVDIGTGVAFGSSVYIFRDIGNYAAAPASSPINLGITGTNNSSNYCVALAIKANDSAFSTMGGLVGTDVNCTVPAQATTLTIGNAYWPGSNNYANGTIASLTYYPKRLTNTELQGLSSQ